MRQKSRGILALFGALISASCLTFVPDSLGTAQAQSVADGELFDPRRVVEGIAIDRAECQTLMEQHTAVWVTVDGDGSCLRYYAAGLNLDGAGNPVVAAWLNGDVLGPNGNNADRRQSGFGPRNVIEQEARLSERFHLPFIYLGRPGTYGSAGKHFTLRGRPREAALINAMLEALKARYGIDTWSLGGHSGGGTLVAEMLARRSDLRCAVISSGAAAYKAYLQARGLLPAGSTTTRFDPYDSIDLIVPDSGRRVFVIGDPRETNVPFSSQAQYFHAIRARGHSAWLVPLEKSNDSRHHDLMDFGEVATGMCARGESTDAILTRLHAMPMQQSRLTN